MSAIEKWNAAKAALYKERETLLDRVREIDEALGIPNSAGKRAPHGELRRTLVQYVTDHPGMTLWDLLTALPGGRSMQNRSVIFSARKAGLIHRVGYRGQARYFLGPAETK